jgi:hypothetical protein
MSRARILAVALASAIIVLTCGVPAAYAASATWESVDVTVHDDQASPVMLVAGQLPEGTALPADVELSVPSGSRLQWVGEILGGPPAQDPEAVYKVATLGDSDVYTFKLTKSRRAQLEAITPRAVMSDGTSSKVSLKWVPSRDVPEVRLSMLIPAGARIVTPAKGASTLPGDAGSSYYQRIVKGVKAGAPVSLAFEYTAPAVVTPRALPATAPRDGSVAGIVLAVALVLLFLVAVAIVHRISATVGAKSQRVATDDVAEESRPEPRNAAMDSSDAGPAEEAARVERPKANRTMRLVTGILIAALAVMVVAVAIGAGKPQVSGDTISRTLSQGDPCVTTTLPLKFPSGTDPVQAADTMFGILGKMDGVRQATVYRTDPRIDIGFCESSASEASLRAALSPTGLLAEGTATPLPK